MAEISGDLCDPLPEETDEPHESPHTITITIEAAGAGGHNILMIGTPPRV